MITQNAAPGAGGNAGATVSYIPFVVGARGHPVFSYRVCEPPHALASASRVMLHGDFSRLGQVFPRPKLAEWRPKVDIAAWLRSLGLEQYEPAFRENAVDVGLLPRLTSEELKDIGVTSVGHRVFWHRKS